MIRSLSFAALLTLLPIGYAQTAQNGMQLARLDGPAWSSSEALPDAPSASLAAVGRTPVEASANDAARAGLAANPGSTTPIAKKYSGIILPGQRAVPWNEHRKFIYALHDSFGPTNLASITLAAGWSHLIDSAPHYGTNAEAFGKREGAAAARSTVQSMTTDAVFAPLFHDDPRYYELGPDHNVVKRAIYAATRVFITRSDSGRDRINAPLLLGYGVAAGVNNLYYPDRDTGAKSTLSGYASSLGGAALGMVANEFLDDALRIVHIRK